MDTAILLFSVWFVCFYFKVSHYFSSSITMTILKFKILKFNKIVEILKLLCVHLRRILISVEVAEEIVDGYYVVLS